MDEVKRGAWVLFYGRPWGDGTTPFFGGYCCCFVVVMFKMAWRSLLCSLQSPYCTVLYWCCGNKAFFFLNKFGARSSFSCKGTIDQIAVLRAEPLANIEPSFFFLPSSACPSLHPSPTPPPNSTCYNPRDRYGIYMYICRCINDSFPPHKIKRANYNIIASDLKFVCVCATQCFVLFCSAC